MAAETPPLTPEQVAAIQEQGARDQAAAAMMNSMSGEEAWAHAADMSNQINGLAMALQQPPSSVLLPNIDPQKERVQQLAACCIGLASIVKMMLIAHNKDVEAARRTKFERKNARKN